MNRFQFEEVLFDALYAPMRAAWEAMDADEAAAEGHEVEEIEFDDDLLFLEC